MQPHNYEFDVEFSFVDEQRFCVERVAEELTCREIRVFYDAYEQATQWDRDLNSYFREVFQEKCHYCVFFASQDYVAKVWPSVERQRVHSCMVR